jgi:hypothetical protein
MNPAQAVDADSSADRFRKFKRLFGPLLITSLIVQIAVVWTQLDYIRGGYFDFVLYHSAARIVADGKGTDLYDLALQREYQTGFRPEPQTRDLPFNHLPYELLPLLPLANFSFTAAHAIWAALNFLLLLIAFYRLLPFIAPSQRHLSCLMLLAFFPTLTTLKMGQDSIITLYLLTETFVSLKRGRSGLAGSVLALGLYKPQFVLPIAGLLLCQRCWPAIRGFVLTTLALISVSLAMVGSQGLIGVLSLWLPMIDRGNVVWPELMLNLRGLVHLILSLGGMSWATNFFTLALSIFTFAIALRSWLQDSPTAESLLDLRFALAVVMTALVSFHLYSYDGTLLAIPLILTHNHFVTVQHSSKIANPIFFALLALMYLPLVPNILLSAAVLAWWALPLPALFWLIAQELRSSASVNQVSLQSR